MTTRLLDLKGLMAYLSLGKDRSRAFGEQAGAVVRYGNRVLYDRERIDRFIDGLERNEN